MQKRMQKQPCVPPCPNAFAMRLTLPPCFDVTCTFLCQFDALQNALSPGQIFLTIHLLDTFGFAVDAIGQHIPDSTQRGGSGFNIGPIRVAYEHKN